MGNDTLQKLRLVELARFVRNRLRERLWVRPLLVCVLSIAGLFIAGLADGTRLGDVVPDVKPAGLSSLLSIMASSMLVIAIFSVSSMVAAYASASQTATPRSFPLVLADDVSQNALSTFLGAFIFSIVALVAVENDYLQRAGIFVAFVFAIITLAVVVLTFVRWVDSIARLGRLGTTIDTVEKAATSALARRREEPTLRGAPLRSEGGRAVHAGSVGYVQRVDVGALQACAEDLDCRIVVEALPGTFAAPGRPLARIVTNGVEPGDEACAEVAKAFRIGQHRMLDDDPRLGLVVLSEIASRALSPAVNDSGTAIDIIGRFARLFTDWARARDREPEPEFDRVEVPELSISDLFDDAFLSIARDGAAVLEVGVRLQKTLCSLALAGNADMQKAARRHARLALARAEKAMALPQEVAEVREVAGWLERRT